MTIKLYPVTNLWGGGTRTVKIIALVRNLSHTVKHYKMYVNNVECQEEYTVDPNRSLEMVFTCQIPFPQPATYWSIYQMNFKILECFDPLFTNCIEHLANTAVLIYNPDSYDLMATATWDTVWVDGTATIGASVCVEANYAGSLSPTTNKGGGAAWVSDTYITPPVPVEDIIYAEYVVVASLVNTTYRPDVGLRWAVLVDRLSGRQVTTYFKDNTVRQVVLPVRYSVEGQRHRVSLKLVIWGNPAPYRSSACLNAAQIYARYVVRQE